MEPGWRCHSVTSLLCPLWCHLGAGWPWGHRDPCPGCSLPLCQRRVCPQPLPPHLGRGTEGTSHPPAVTTDENSKVFLLPALPWCPLCVPSLSCRAGFVPPPFCCLFSSNLEIFGGLCVACSGILGVLVLFLVKGFGSHLSANKTFGFAQFKIPTPVLCPFPFALPAFRETLHNFLFLFNL